MIVVRWRHSREDLLRPVIHGEDHCGLGMERAPRVKVYHLDGFLVRRLGILEGHLLGEVVGEQYRAFLWSLFTDLAEAAGARNPKQLGRQLFLLYDGAAVAARMDKDRGAAADAVRSAVEALLDSEIPAKRGKGR